MLGHFTSQPSLKAILRMKRQASPLGVVETSKLVFFVAQYSARRRIWTYLYSPHLDYCLYEGRSLKHWLCLYVHVASVFGRYPGCQKA